MSIRLNICFRVALSGTLGELSAARGIRTAPADFGVPRFCVCTSRLGERCGGAACCCCCCTSPWLCASEVYSAANASCRACHTRFRTASGWIISRRSFRDKSALSSSSNDTKPCWTNNATCSWALTPFKNAIRDSEASSGFPRTTSCRGMCTYASALSTEALGDNKASDESARTLSNW